MRMMNIVWSFHLLFTTFISVCLTARLTDDQLAQILSDKLSTGPLRDNREYPTVDELKEFQGRLLALEKLDEVADRLLDDELQTDEDLADGPNIDSNTMVQDDEERDTDSTDDDELTDSFLQAIDTGSKPDRNFLDIIDKHVDNTVNQHQISQTPYADCNEFLYTKEEFQKCLEETYAENNFNNIYNGFNIKSSEAKEKRNPACGKYGCRYNGKRNTKNNENLKMNKICGPFGCSWREGKRNPLCGSKYTCTGKRKILQEKIEKDKKQVFCSRFGCGVGKRFFLVNKYPGPSFVKENQHSKVKKSRGSTISDKRGFLYKKEPVQGQDGLETTETDPSSDTKEYEKDIEVNERQLKEDLRRVIGTICNTSINGCQFRKGRRKLIKNRRIKIK